LRLDDSHHGWQVDETQHSLYEQRQLCRKHKMLAQLSPEKAQCGRYIELFSPLSVEL
jgi:hypothetical protein